MRRSKSNPAKYARNYRSISQRRMTEEERVDVEEEIKQLRHTIKEQGDKISASGGSKRKRPENDEPTGNAENVLAKELVGDAGYGDDGGNPLIVVRKKKKGPKEPKPVALTPREMKQAKQLQKKAERKLKQLETRAAQKEKRKALYAKLETSALSQDSMKLLSSSSKLGHQDTKKEQLRKLLRKERAGVSLSADEHNVLYRDRREIASGEGETDTVPKSPSQQTTSDVATEQPNKRKREKRENKESERESSKPDSSQKGPQSKKKNTDHTDTGEQEGEEAKLGDKEKPKATSFASQMMASLSKLKQKEKVRPKGPDETSFEKIARTEQEGKGTTAKPYIPETPIELKTPAALGMKPAALPKNGNNLKIKKVQRPKDIQDSRFDLPVSAMEFEVMDAIRNNDVTIICGETGSGKSTQIPQFLYEFGFSGGNTGDNDETYLIGVTQPRRVAAVSTAKRVCFEMGAGDGQSIQSTKKGEGNLVAYQTRYETAGLGGETQVKFMTDGILLQEIQSDLLLRKYGVIILDEAHERGLNTDILIGLLSKAIPLRREASVESGSSVPPLKLIIMSATLRVEDFTGNKNLFPSKVPAVVKIPGRTHPVTIHHSRVTELVEYEDIALKKICKIHRKLPQGGILVFLTGKQEIVKMVKKLRKCLNKQSRTEPGRFEEVETHARTADDSLRDLDDEEVDGDVFREENDNEVDEAESSDLGNEGERGDNVPEHAIILPLYSLLSADEQAKVFAPVPDGHRLIVVATNIAETSITIPGISYVVDSGRQKCRTFDSATGVVSYDITWISKAAANQRAGRAGRTGPGHCYRLYSSTMFSRHMEAFSVPEVLSRPLEDVVLAMKSMHISEVESFPFPTQPKISQVKSSIKLLADLGCVDISDVEVNGGDGKVTRLGAAVAKLPLGVRCGKILLVAAQAGVLDYGIAIVAALSEKNPFVTHGQTSDVQEKEENNEESESESDEEQEPGQKKKSKSSKWTHKAGDVLAILLAIGAYTFAGKGVGGKSEKLACQKFCEENGLHFPIMERIQKMRIHLARLSKVRLANAESIASKTGSILYSMPPPSRAQERLLCQSVASGMLDNIAMLAPVGSISGQHPYSLRSAYLSCSKGSNEPLFMDRNSVVHSRDSRLLPKWLCYESLLEKTLKDGSVISVMKNVTPIDPAWLGKLAQGSRLLSIGEPLPTPAPTYDASLDRIMCSAKTQFGDQKWSIPSIKVEMREALESSAHKGKLNFLPDDCFRWFGRYLLEGKVIAELEGFEAMLKESPATITKRLQTKRVTLLVSCLARNEIDSLAKLREHWARQNRQLLFRELKDWIKEDKKTEAAKIWKRSVKLQVDQT